MATLDIHIDGGSRGNPGPAGAGVVIREKTSGQLLYEGGRFLGRMTNNVAEYSAMLHALSLVQRCGVDRLEIRSDSELMVSQILGMYKVKSAKLKPLYERCMEALAGFEHWRVMHVRREKNKRADELANLAMDSGRHVTVVNRIDSLDLSGGDAGDGPSAGAPPAAASDVAADSWTARIAEEGVPCPLGVEPGERFAFGPVTPRGFCVHAAAAMFAAMAEDEGESLRATCPHCGAVVDVQRGE